MSVITNLIDGCTDEGKRLKMHTSEINIRDPFVLVHEGKYYMYGTRGETAWGLASGFDVYVGTDLDNWDPPCACFENDGTFWADRHYWAPEVHVWRDKFYMFASFKSETVHRGTAILVADHPTGPFKPHSNGPVTPGEWECLDGTFYVSRDGTPYIVFCHEWLEVGDGEVWAAQMNDDLSATVGTPFLLFKASGASWCRETGSPPHCGYVTDGPFLWRTNTGELLCLWASMSESGYTEGLAMSDNGEIDGKFLQLEPLFDRDGGHAMVFRGLDGELYMTLHCPNIHPLERPRFIRVVELNGALSAPEA